MKTLYDEIISPAVKKGSAKSLIPPAICVAVPTLFLLLFHLTKQNKTLMNWLIRNLTDPIKHGVSYLCDFAPFAVAEILWLIAIAAGVIFLIRTIWLLIRRPHRLLRLGRRFLALLSAVLIVYCGYTAMWGINYYGDNFTDLSGITARGATTEELTVLTTAFANALNETCGSVSRDSDGVFSMDLDTMFAESEGLYDGICQEFPFLSGSERTPKQLISSRLMSRLDFTGFYFPFTAETLLNVDAPQCLIPATILHEKAHQRGIAAEDECNFVAVIAGIRSGNDTYAYSSCLLAFIHVGNALYSVDRDTYWEIRNTLDDRVSADLAANSAYWAQFDTKTDEVLESVSSAVYDGFLQGYGESDGKRSYGRCVDLLVAYYFDYYWA